MPVLVAGVVFSGCTRKAPTGLPPQAEVPTLQPVATYVISPAIAEASGICYRKVSNSLLVVSDDRGEVFEIDLTGRVIRSIPIACVDLEGVAVTGSGDTLYVVQERPQLVTAVRWDGTELFSFSVRVATAENHALEGVTLDKYGNLYVVNEKDPRMLLRYRGRAEVARVEITAFTDLSDICYDEAEDCLWIISDESLKIGKFSREGVLLGEWFIPFSKGEGIAVVGRTLYVVQDGESKLYAFDKP
ncbi:MAG: SdiA-regulated domain-containing protein [Calditrichaeota bacterium]|nr:SdiA-regulated domain-containing protein [Calditrichota bacterium]